MLSVQGHDLTSMMVRKVFQRKGYHLEYGLLKTNLNGHVRLQKTIVAIIMHVQSSQSGCWTGRNELWKVCNRWIVAHESKPEVFMRMAILESNFTGGKA